MEPVVVVVETVGNSARFGFWRRVSHSCHHLGHASRGWVKPFVSSTERETACYSWPDSDVRHTLVDAALSRADPKALGSLSPKTNLSAGLRLFVLRVVEAFPGADGLLCGQRSCEIFWPQNVRPLFLQDGVNARRQLPSHRDNGFARRYFLGVTMIDAQIEGAQFRILSDRGPGALNQLVAQPAVARAGNPAAICFLAGGVLARDNSEESSNLAHVANLPPVAQPGHQMGRHDHPDAGKTGEQTDRLPQFRIVCSPVFPASG